MDVFNNRETESILEIYSLDYVYHIPGQKALIGREAFVEYCRMVVNAFPDITLTIDEIFGQGDSVAFRYTMKGTHTGEFTKGIQPTGRQFQYTGMVINHFSDGKEVETWESYDRLDLMQQLGLIPTN